jgi:alkylhydroperoxidase family enzyme
VSSAYIDERWLRVLLDCKIANCLRKRVNGRETHGNVDFEKSPLFNDRERAALRFATLFKSSDDGIDSDDVYSDLKKHFNDEEIIELALLCAEADGVGKFARSLRMRTWEESCSIQPLLKRQAVSAEAAE